MGKAKINNKWNISYLKKILAGTTARGENTLLSDSILLAQKLEQFDFTYSRGKVVLVEPIQEQKHV